MASQFLWRCVRAKLLARDDQHAEADSILAEAVRLIADSDWLDWQGEGFLDLAARGNLVSARRASALAQELQAASLGSAS